MKVPGKLVALCCAVVLVDTVFFAALSPLLPMLRAAHGLTKGDAGLLTGAYAFGVLAGSIPGGLLASRAGVKPTTLLGITLTSLGALGFGLAGGISGLTAARLLGGVGSACSWAAAVSWLAESVPRERRGEMIGVTVSAAVAGALAGPVLGALAASIGAALAFSSMAAAGVLLLAWVLATPGLPPQGLPPLARVRASLGHPGTGTGLGLVFLTPLLFSVMGVLVPLELGRLGWTAGAIALAYVVTAALEAVAHPLTGRWSDRAGPVTPSRVGLAVAAVVLLLLPLPDSGWALAILILPAGVAFGMPMVPGMALVTTAGEEAGLGSAASLGLVNLAWALGYAVGAPAGGALADRAGDYASYLALAVICTGTCFVLPRLLPEPAGAHSGHRRSA